MYLNYNNKPIEEKNIDIGLICVEVQEGILFTDFVENEFIYKDKESKHKEFVIINRKGFYYKYLFNEQNIFDENDDNDFELIYSFQWI